VLRRNGIDPAVGTLRRVARRFALGLAPIALMAWLGVCPMPTAAAADYTVAVCTAASSGGDGLSYQEVEVEPGKLFLQRCGAVEPGTIQIGSPLGGRELPGAKAAWKLTAPEGTRIEQLRFAAEPLRSNPGNPSLPASFLEWLVLVEDRGVARFFEEGQGFMPANFNVNIAPHSHSVGAGIFCVDIGFGFCGNGGSFEVKVRSLVVEMGDEFTPGFSNVTLPPSVAHGTVPVGITGEDKGSGIAKEELFVDGSAEATVMDENEGKCVAPYKFLQPCKLIFPASFELDTTKLTEGQHELKFVTTDVAGLSKETSAVTFFVHNTPINLGRPTIAGENRVGSPLKATTGRWENAPASFAYQWFRCPASVRGEGTDVKACRAVAGATSAQYTPVADDLGQRDLVQVTAANATGSEPSISLPTDLIQEPLPPPPPPPPPSKTKPVLSHLTLSRKRFQVGSTLESHRGAVLAFSCSKPGHLTIAIERVGGKGKKSKVLGKLAAAIKAGRSKLILTGELGTRRLKPGSYQVTLQVKGNNGALSDPAGVPFAILPG
jgi:hypothetical protein